MFEIKTIFTVPYMYQSNLHSGTRPRSEYGIKWKYIRILAGLGVTTFTILYLFESGDISFANPADQYVTQTLLTSHSDSDNDKPLAKREQNTRNEV